MSGKLPPVPSDGYAIGWWRDQAPAGTAGCWSKILSEELAKACADDEQKEWEFDSCGRLFQVRKKGEILWEQRQQPAGKAGVIVRTGRFEKCLDSSSSSSSGASSSSSSTMAAICKATADWTNVYVEFDSIGKLEKVYDCGREESADRRLVWDKDKAQPGSAGVRIRTWSLEPESSSSSSSCDPHYDAGRCRSRRFRQRKWVFDSAGNLDVVEVAKEAVEKPCTRVQNIPCCADHMPEELLATIRYGIADQQRYTVCAVLGFDPASGDRWKGEFKTECTFSGAPVKYTNKIELICMNFGPTGCDWFLKCHNGILNARTVRECCPAIYITFEGISGGNIYDPNAVCWYLCDDSASPGQDCSAPAFGSVVITAVPCHNLCPNETECSISSGSSTDPL